MQNLTREISKFSTHQRFQYYGKNAKGWMRKCAMLLPEIENEYIWKKKGFFSIYEYAAKLAGMSKYAVDDALRIMDKLKDRPMLKKIAVMKGLNAVRPVLTISTTKTDKFWAEKVNQLSQKALKVYVKEFRGIYGGGGNCYSAVNSRDVGIEAGAGAGIDSDKCHQYDIENKENCGVDPGNPENMAFVSQNKNIIQQQGGNIMQGENENMIQQQGGNIMQGGNLNKNVNKAQQKVNVSMKLSIEVLEKLKKMKGDYEWNELISAMIDEYVEVEEVVDGKQVEVEEVVDGKQVQAVRKNDLKPEPVWTKSRHIPNKIKKYVIKKSGGLCQYKGCSKKYEILHHTQRFGLEKVHDPDKIVALCKAHERIVHAGLIENEDYETSKWKMREVVNVVSKKYLFDQIVVKYYSP